MPAFVSKLVALGRNLEMTHALRELGEVETSSQRTFRRAPRLQAGACTGWSRTSSRYDLPSHNGPGKNSELATQGGAAQRSGQLLTFNLKA